VTSRKHSKLFEDLLAGAQEAVAWHKGEKVLTVRDVELKPLPPMSAREVTAIRTKLRVSQAAFARILNVSAKTVQAWETNARRPSDAALKLLSISQNEAAGTLTSFELLSDIAVDFSVRHGIDIRDPLASKHRWYVLMELSSPRDDARTTLEAILAQGLEMEIVDDAVIAASLSQRSAFWKLRDEMSAAQKPEGGSIKHDISVPVVAVPDFIEQANAAVVKLIPGARPVPFGHLGDGNIHYNVSQPIGGDTADFMSRWHDVNAVVFDIVLKMGGSISAEHGIGVLKRDELPEVKDKVAIELMRGIKAMLDPLGIMNPGKVL